MYRYTFFLVHRYVVAASQESAKVLCSLLLVMVSNEMTWKPCVMVMKLCMDNLLQIFLYTLSASCTLYFLIRGLHSFSMGESISNLS